MKKSDVVDLTIRPETRQVGDVVSISTSDTAKSGADSPDLSVGAPETMGQPSGATSEQKQYNTPYNPSLDGLPVPDGDQTSGRAQPDMGQAPDAGSTAQTTKSGAPVKFPDAADTMSAGGAKMIGTGGSLVLKTGSVVKFPAASDTSMQPKMVDTFGMK